MYVCTCIFIYTDPYGLTHMHIHIIFISTYIISHTCEYKYICVYMCEYIYMCIYTYVHIYTHVYICIYIYLIYSSGNNFFLKREDHSLLFYPRGDTVFYFLSEFSSNQLLKIVPQAGNFVLVNLFRSSCTLKAVKYFRAICDFISKSTLNVEQKLSFLSSARAHR